MFVPSQSHHGFLLRPAPLDIPQRRVKAPTGSTAENPPTGFNVMYPTRGEVDPRASVSREPQALYVYKAPGLLRLRV